MPNLKKARSAVRDKIINTTKKKVLSAQAAIAEIAIDHTRLSTGLAKANWQASINNKITNELTYQAFGVDESKIEFYKRIISEDAAFDIATSFTDFNLGDTLWITNSVHYLDVAVLEDDIHAKEPLMRMAVQEELRK